MVPVLWCWSTDSYVSSKIFAVQRLFLRDLGENSGSGVSIQFAIFSLRCPFAIGSFWKWLQTFPWSPIKVRQAAVAVLVLLIGLLDGSAGPNRFGPDPRARSATAFGLGLLQFVAQRMDRWTVFGLAMVGLVGLLANQLAMPIARLLPKVFTMRVAERAIFSAVRQMYRCKAQDTRVSLERLAYRLDPELSVRIHVTSHPYVEGLALVGGKVLVGQDTLRSALVPEEIAALMAHELAHIRLMHAERALVSQLAFAALPGSLSNVFNTGWGLAYSRDQEREADAIAIETLTWAEIDPHYLGSLLERLEQERLQKRRGKGGDVPLWLATHPSLPDRLSTIAKAQRPAITRPAMTSLDCVDVHIGCV